MMCYILQNFNVQFRSAKYTNMIDYVVGGILLLLLYLTYTQYIAPKRIHTYYLKKLNELGYKVYVFPFKPMGAPFMERILSDIDQHKDVRHSMQHDYLGHDLILTNVTSNVQLVFLKPSLGQHIISADGVMLAPKQTQFFDLMYQQTKKSLIFVEGQEWKQRRKILSSLFNYNLLMERAPSIVDLCNRMMDWAEEKSKKSHPNSDTLHFSLQDMGRSIFGNVVISLFLGMDSNQERIDGEPLNHALGELNDLTTKLAYNPIVVMLGSKAVDMRFNADCKRLIHLRKATKKVLYKYIEKYVNEFKEKKANNETYKPKTIIEHMVQQLQGEPNLEQLLCDEVYIFVVAGEETTSNLFVSAMLMLFQHPKVLSKLREEIDRSIKSDADITGDNIKKMEYLNLVWKESLRHRSPALVIFDRYASQNMMVGDIPVAKGTALSYNYKMAMFDKANFDEPLEFSPERWLEERYKTTEMQVITEMNFSGGPRACIGKQLAYLEGKITIIKFLKRYDNLKELKERVFCMGLTSRFRDSEVEVTRYEQKQ